MEKKNIGMKISIIILCLLVVGLTGYILYDKVLSNDNSNNNIIDNSDNNQQLGSNRLSNDEALIILKDSYNDVVRHIFNEGVSYCGEYDYDDDIDLNITSEFSFSKSATFNSIEELDSYVKKYLTEELLSTTRYNQSVTFNGVTTNSYYEKDGNLYCNNWNKGSNMLLATFSKNESNYEILSINNDSFVGKINAVYYDVDNNKSLLKIKLTIIKRNGNWLIDSYEEIG